MLLFIPEIPLIILFCNSCCCQRPGLQRFGPDREKAADPSPAAGAGPSRTHERLVELQGPSEGSKVLPLSQIVSSAKDVVTTARDAVSGRVSSAVQRTRGAVQGGMERTRAVVLESRVVRLVSSGVDTALSTSESLVEQYLPVTEEELGESG